MLIPTTHQVIADGCPFTWARKKTARPPTRGVLRFTLSDFSGWKVYFLDNATELSAYLPAPEGDVWLHPVLMEYLMEEPQGVETGLLLLEHEKGERIIASVQTLTFNADSQIRQDEVDSGRWGFRRMLSRLFSFRVLTLGQFLVSGMHGAERINGRSDQTTRLPDLLDQSLRELARRLGGYSATLIKDMAKLDDEAVKAWQSEGYYHLPVDPSMQMTLRKKWKTLADYLADISSKYRVRYRRARKQLGDKVTQRRLDPAEIWSLNPSMYEMYRGIKAEAAFDAIDLSPLYFADMADRFPDRFKVNGYFIDRELIGFRTTLDNGGTLHAHYLGFDRKKNAELHLYHNMLFDLLEDAINGGFERLDYGRTALEIKSSIGAVPVEYFCGIRGRNWLIRLIIERFTPAVFRPTKWKQRNPIK